MADIQLDTQGIPATPAAGTGVLYFDSTNKEAILLDDVPAAKVLRTLSNANTADVTCSSVNTYLTGSSITVPPAKLRAAGAKFHWKLKMNKTNVGTAVGATVTIVFGPNGTTADTARVTFTFGTQSGAVDDGWMDIDCVVRSGGNTATTQIEACAFFYHTLAATGLDNTQFKLFQSTPGTFDTTGAIIVGLCCNPGATGSPVWTFQHVGAEGLNL